MNPRCGHCGGVGSHSYDCSLRRQEAAEMGDMDMELDDCANEDAACSCREYRNTHRCDHMGNVFEQEENPLMSVDVHNAIALAERMPARLDEVQDLERRLEVASEICDELDASYAELARKAVALLVAYDNSESGAAEFQRVFEDLRSEL